MYAIVAVFVSICFATCYSGDVTITTNVGQISGLQTNITIDGLTKTISMFYGIPFAETTAGANRFQKPVPKAPFTDTFEATTYGITCFQTSKLSELIYQAYGSYSEDCLILNVYVPHDLQSDQQSLPVMVWIFGGRFVEGSSSVYQGETLSAFGDVIVVTINYRVGMFGFLRSSDGEYIGNQGLWDQQLAIKWVHDNIAAFSGNPDDITIFGESAGSASVLYQAMYPGNEGLFKRVISESGLPNTLYAFQDPTFDGFLALTPCKNATNHTLCLLEAASQDLQFGFFGDSVPFTPTLDGDFIKADPREVLFGDNPALNEQREFFASLDILIGVNNKEGASFVLYAGMPDDFSTAEFNMTKGLFNIGVDYCMEYLLGVTDEVEKNMTRNLIEFTYTDWSDPDDMVALRDSMVDLIGDTTMVAPCVAVTKAHATLSNKNTYSYLFSAKPSQHVNAQVPVWIDGADHTDEIDFLFGFPLIGRGGWKVNATYTENEKTLSKVVMTMWTNFAKTGNPNNPPVDIAGYSSATWPKFSTDHQRYLDINMDESIVRERLFATRIQLWNHLVPKLMTLIPVAPPTAPPTTPKPMKETNGQHQIVSSVLLIVTGIMLIVIMH